MQLLNKVQEKDIPTIDFTVPGEQHTPAFMLEDNPQPQSSNGAQELPIATDSDTIHNLKAAVAMVPKSCPSQLILTQTRSTSSAKSYLL